MKFLHRLRRSHESEHEVDVREVVPGSPGHCPSCDRLGYIDAIDIRHGFQTVHCPRCGCVWTSHFDDHSIEITSPPTTGHVIDR